MLQRCAFGSLAVFVMIAVGCGDNKTDGNKTDGGGNKVDLSSKEATIRTFHKAAVDGDKATMKKCLSKKWLDGLGDNFEKYCDDVREKAKTTPVEHYLKQLPTMKMVQEDGDWKIDDGK